MAVEGGEGLVGEDLEPEGGGFPWRGPDPEMGLGGEGGAVLGVFAKDGAGGATVGAWVCNCCLQPGHWTILPKSSSRIIILDLQ